MITDAHPRSWRSDRQPDPSLEELNLLGLAKLYAEADRAVQCRAGSVSLETYRDLTARRKALIAELLEAAGKYQP